MSSKHRDEYLITPAGQRLFCQCWEPAPASPRAVVVVTHGYGEHSVRYRDFALALNRAGFAAQFYDLRGHGRSEGPRGHVDDFDNYLKDLRFFLEHCQREYQGLPVLLFGHSLGGLIVLAYCQGEALAGLRAVAVTSPFFAVALPVPAWKIKLGDIVRRIYPRFAMPTGYGGEVLSHDPQVVAAFDNDPLVVGTVTAGWFHAVRQAQQRYGALAERITLPTLIIHAGDDRLVSMEVSERFAAGLGGEHEFHRAEGAFHEVLNEPDHKERATEQIIAWFEKSLAK